MLTQHVEYELVKTLLLLIVIVIIYFFYYYHEYIYICKMDISLLIHTCIFNFCEQIT